MTFRRFHPGWVIALPLGGCVTAPVEMPSPVVPDAFLECTVPARPAPGSIQSQRDGAAAYERLRASASRCEANAAATRRLLHPEEAVPTSAAVVTPDSVATEAGS